MSSNLPVIISLVIAVLLLIPSVILAAFFTKHGSNPPYYQERFAWRATSQLIWLAGLVVFVGVPLTIWLFTTHMAARTDLFRVLLGNGMVLALLAPVSALLVARGNLDFSMAGVLVLSGNILAWNAHDHSLFAGIALALAAALGLGLTNAVLISVTRFSSTLVTLGSLGLCSLLMVLAASNTVDPLLAAGIGPVNTILGMSPELFWWILALLLALVLLVLAEFTPMARPGKVAADDESIGQRLLFVGVPFIFSALAAGLAGMALTLRYTVAPRSTGTYSLVDVWATVVLGGTAFGGRVAGIAGALLAAFLVTAFGFLMDVSLLPSTLRVPLLALILLVFGLLALQYHNLVAWFYHRKHRAPTGFPVLPAQPK